MVNFEFTRLRMMSSLKAYANKLVERMCTTIMHGQGYAVIRKGRHKK